ncbi:rhodanese-like domain-containing protein [Pontiella agarivorans]|uniref:Rhodanese-like domain-containing protein n=1 Tax=Pontiella agarivorans TaxID=3038953 RepID=A0ABU5MZ38_9BACT|nr:rhodanese-like domain-containing protein [Pontiella agarivorans]MDZ8119356.1 rhodanese-like domain-containing protein [Pontiella agarivorans]
MNSRLDNDPLVVHRADLSIRKLKLPHDPGDSAHDREAPMPEAIDVVIDEINLADFEVIDIREPDEVAKEPLPCEHQHIPMNDLLGNPSVIDKEKAYLLVCAAGVRTNYTANAFRSAGYSKVYSLVGGNRVLSA